MAVFQKIALFFVVIYSVVIIVNTYLGESERVESNVFYLLINGFAYVVSAIEVEKEKFRLNASF